MRNIGLKRQGHGFAHASRMVGNRHGAALALVAISLVVILGMGALAVDMGMLIKQREDAQRAADAAALAGASAYQDFKPLDAVDSATGRAFEYLARNYVGGTWIDTAGKAFQLVGTDRYVTTSREGTVVVLPDSHKVRVIVRRAAVGTFFARTFGVFSVPISAKAAAIAIQSGTGKCVKPFAVPDYWSDADNDDDPANRLEDLGPGQGRGGENWEFSPDAGDRYQRWEDPDSLNSVETGIGSEFRNESVDGDGNRYYDDSGRPIVLKKSNPQQTPSPSFFLPWVLPGSNPGAQDYKNNIVGCNPAQISLETDYNLDGTADTSSYDNKPGNMIGPTKQGMDSLISLDPDACWASKPDSEHLEGGMVVYTTGQVMKYGSTGQCDQPYPNWKSSPRVAIVPLFNPKMVDNGRTSLRFNNLALIFIEDQQNRHDPVVARFIQFTKSSGPPDPNSGALTLTLRLVE